MGTEQNEEGHSMARTSQDGKVLVYVLVALALIIGGLIVAAWATRTPLYTLEGADHPDCVTPAPDRDVLIGLAVSGGGSRAALFAAGAMEALGKMRVGRSSGRYWSRSLISPACPGAAWLPAITSRASRGTPSPC